MNKTKALHKLLEQTPEAYYWLGFILADGSFVSESWGIKRIRLGCATKDISHLHYFATFIKSSNKINTSVRNTTYGKYKFSSICVSNTRVVSKIMELFALNASPKTYNPPDISWIKDVNLFYSFVIGFIDGDGNISKQSGRSDNTIKIKVHRSWKLNIDYILEKLYSVCSLNTYPRPKINKKGYCTGCISHSRVIALLKNKTTELDLPVLKRKWDVVDTTFVSMQELSKERIIKVKHLIKLGKNREIAQTLCMSDSGVSMLIKRNKLRRHKDVKEK